MRVDTDTYLWGVAKIVIDHKDVGSENQRTQLRFFDEHGEEATAITLCIWGVGSMASRTMPKIMLTENGVERELVPDVLGELAKDHNVRLEVDVREGGDK
jgi:hypothetical protein